VRIVRAQQLQLRRNHRIVRQSLEEFIDLEHKEAGYPDGRLRLVAQYVVKESI
jgi:hypothetical protein